MFAKAETIRHSSVLSIGMGLPIFALPSVLSHPTVEGLVCKWHPEWPLSPSPTFPPSPATFYSILNNFFSSHFTQFP